MSAASPAEADAWLPAPQTAQTIVTIAPHPGGGTRAPGSLAVELYHERALADGVALVLAPSAGVPGDDRVPAGAGPASDAGPYEQMIALRLRLPAPGPWQASAQLAVVNSTGLSADVPGDVRFTAFEPRLALGRGFEDGWWVDGSVALRGCPGLAGWSEVTRWGLAGGRNSPDGSGFIIKAFGTETDCGEAALGWQASWLVPLGAVTTVELGWRGSSGATSVLPGNASQDRRLAEGPPQSGPMIAIWTRY